MSLLLLNPSLPKDDPRTQAATLADVKIVPRCYGLDCAPPPFPILFDVYLCFQMGDAYYVGTYSPWGFPWAPPGKKLLVLKGKIVEIVLDKNRIRMKAPLNLNLKRIHNNQGSCSEVESS
jgi:hypothetical protein